MNSGADPQSLILTGFTGPHYQHYFYKIIYYGYHQVHVINIIVYIDHGLAILPKQYKKVEFESDLAERYNYGNEEM